LANIHLYFGQIFEDFFTVSSGFARQSCYPTTSVRKQWLDTKSVEIDCERIYSVFIDQAKLISWTNPYWTMRVKISA